MASKLKGCRSSSAGNWEPVLSSTRPECPGKIAQRQVALTAPHQPRWRFGASDGLRSSPFPSLPHVHASNVNREATPGPALCRTLPGDMVSQLPVLAVWWRGANTGVPTMLRVIPRKEPKAEQPKGLEVTMEELCQRARPLPRGHRLTAGETKETGRGNPGKSQP